MKRETIIVLAAASLGVAALYACGGDGGSSSNPANDAGGNGDATSPPPPPPGGGDDGGAQDGGGDGGTTSCLGGNCIEALTEHYDNARTGLYGAESKLKPTNVNEAMFGKAFELTVDGKVDAQPLYLQAVAIAGKGTHDVIYVVTEHDSIYAFDANAAGAPLWQVSALGAGEAPSDDRGCDQVTPEMGITATPVIDRTTGTMYVVAMSKKGGTYHQRLHAIDITSGAEKLGGPKEIVATYPGSTSSEGNGTTLTFDPKQHKERSALLLDHGRVYTSWSSHCDFDPYTGWVMAHDEATLAVVAIWNTEPNGAEASFWSAGAGPAADSAGNVYHMSGNGGFDTTLTAGGFPNQSNYGNSFVKLATSSTTIGLTDYFTMGDEVAQSDADVDLGSGGVMLLPDAVGSAAHPHLLVGSGKDGHLYLLDRDKMGHFAPGGGNAGAVQDVPNATATAFTSDTGEFGAPAYFDGAIYFGGVGEPLERWTIANATIATPHASETSDSFGFPGTTPTISWDGTDKTTAIVWAHENTSPMTLHAYSAADLATEYWNSAQAAGQRDVPTGAGNKFIIPLVANGRVYVGTQSSVVVYGSR
ncbi:MAG TPA: hypothetical protein VIF62_30995 [Labilithrix sp.]